MMPPHFDRISPPPGTPLNCDTISVIGYSLRYAQDPQVFDDSAGAQLEVSLELNVERVGRGLEMADPPPGSIQEQSTLSVKILKHQPGHSYRMEYLDETFTWPASS